jgi:Fe-S-cluster containining protein
MDNNFEKVDNLDSENDKFPQYLCKMCAKCCKSITTSISHEELLKMASKGSEEAKVFTEFFIRFESLEEARKVIPDQIEQILEELKSKENFDIEKVTFYYCSHVTPEYKCGMYESRPECCKRAPVNGWSCMPPGCGFEGWQFEEREKVKKKIRKLKEYLIAVEAISTDGKVPGKHMTVEELRELVESKLKFFEKYGSRYW